MARSPEKTYGWLIPLGMDGKDAALFPIKRQFYVVGSGQHVNIRLPKKGIDPWHVSIIVDSDENIFMKNLHGTKLFEINNKHISETAQLKHLDIVQFGRHTFRFEDSSSRPSLDSATTTPSKGKKSSSSAHSSSAKPTKTRTPTTTTKTNATSVQSALPTSAPPTLPKEGQSTAVKVSSPAKPRSSPLTETAPPEMIRPSVLVPQVPLAPLPDSNLGETDTSRGSTHPQPHSTDMSHTPPSSADTVGSRVTRALITQPPTPNRSHFSPNSSTYNEAVTEPSRVTEERVHIASKSLEDSSDDLFLSQEPVRPRYDQRLKKVEQAIDIEAAVDKALNPSSEIEDAPDSVPQADLVDFLPLSDSNHLQPMDLEEKEPSPPPKRTSVKKTVSASAVASAVSAPRSRRSATRKISPPKTTKVTPSSDDEDSNKGLRRSTRPKSRKVMEVPDFTEGSPDLLFEDENNISTLIDDEGRSPTVRAERRRAANKPSPEVAKPATNSKKRKVKSSTGTNSTTYDETEAPSPLKKPLPLPNLNSAASDFAAPPANLSRNDLMEHVTREVLKHHRTLTHRQVMKEVSEHEPFANALRRFPGNWRMDLVALLGQPTFMPQLRREFNIVTLPPSE